MKKNQFWICKNADGYYLAGTLDKRRKVCIVACEDLYIEGSDYQGSLWSDARKAGWSCVRVELSEVTK